MFNAEYFRVASLRHTLENALVVTCYIDHGSIDVLNVSILHARCYLVLV